MRRMEIFKILNGKAEISEIRTTDSNDVLRCIEDYNGDIDIAKKFDSHGNLISEYKIDPDKGYIPVKIQENKYDKFDRLSRSIICEYQKPEINIIYSYDEFESNCRVSYEVRDMSNHGKLLKFGNKIYYDDRYLNCLLEKEYDIINNHTKSITRKYDNYTRRLEYVKTVIDDKIVEIIEYEYILADYVKEYTYKDDKFVKLKEFNYDTMQLLKEKDNDGNIIEYKYRLAPVLDDSPEFF